MSRRNSDRNNLSRSSGLCLGASGRRLRDVGCRPLGGEHRVRAAIYVSFSSRLARRRTESRRGPSHGMSQVARGRGRVCASLSLGAIHTHRFNAFRRHRMSQTVAARINELDDKQAIFQVKLLLQSAMDSTPDLMAMDDAAIATKLKAIDSDAPDTLAEAAAIMT